MARGLGLGLGLPFAPAPLAPPALALAPPFLAPGLATTLATTLRPPPPPPLKVTERRPPAGVMVTPEERVMPPGAPPMSSIWSGRPSSLTPLYVLMAWTASRLLAKTTSAVPCVEVVKELVQTRSVCGFNRREESGDRRRFRLFLPGWLPNIKKRRPTLDRPFWSKLRPDFCTLPICANSSCEWRIASGDWERGFDVRVHSWRVSASAKRRKPR